MKPHREIITDAGVSRVHKALGAGVSVHTVRSWVQRDSIPAAHWLALSSAGIATLEELARGIRPAPPPSEQAAA